MKRPILFLLFSALLATRSFAEPTPAATSEEKPLAESAEAISRAEGTESAETASPAESGSVYARVYDALAALPERRIGSENYAKAFDAVEAELKAAGLVTHRQTFDSLAQVTERLSLTYSGKPVEGALLVDNGLANFVLPEPVRGPALYVGDGETACEMAARKAAGRDLVDHEGNPAEPGWDGNMFLYRATLVDPKAARDYLMCCLVHDAPPHSNELIPFADAAKELGITRQGAYDLVKRGIMPGEHFDGLRVGRYSVVLRNAAKTGSGGQ